MYSSIIFFIVSIHQLLWKPFVNEIVRFIPPVIFFSLHLSRVLNGFGAKSPTALDLILLFVEVNIDALWISIFIWFMETLVFPIYPGSAIHRRICQYIHRLSFRRKNKNKKTKSTFCCFFGNKNVIFTLLVQDEKWESGYTCCRKIKECEDIFKSQLQPIQIRLKNCMCFAINIQSQ